MVDAYSDLDGNPNGNKDDVIQNVQWQRTGRQNTQYAAPGAQLPTTGAGSGSNSAPSSTMQSVAVSSSKAPQSPTQSPTSAPGGSIGSSGSGSVGTKCGLTQACAAGLTCLSPQGTCQSAQCDWG